MIPDETPMDRLSNSEFLSSSCRRGKDLHEKQPLEAFAYGRVIMLPEIEY
jgi:hypothetical protein